MFPQFGFGISSIDSFTVKKDKSRKKKDDGPKSGTTPIPNGTLITTRRESSVGQPCSHFAILQETDIKKSIDVQTVYNYSVY